MEVTVLCHTVVIIIMNTGKTEGCYYVVVSILHLKGPGYDSWQGFNNLFCANLYVQFTLLLNPVACVEARSLVISNISSCCVFTEAFSKSNETMMEKNVC